MSKNQKSKNLYYLGIEDCSIRLRLFYNINTNYIGISTSYNYEKESNKKYRNKYKYEIKQYRNNNKDKIKKYNKEYQQIHKIEIKQKRENILKDHIILRFLRKNLLSNLPKVKLGYVYHHIIYDHNNPNNYIIEMTRSDHAKLHRKMQKDGIEIQHINVRINDIHRF